MLSLYSYFDGGKQEKITKKFLRYRKKQGMLQNIRSLLPIYLFVSQSQVLGFIVQILDIGN